MNPPFDPTVLQIEGETVVLRGSECIGCTALLFPARAVCARCGEQTRDCLLPTTGVVRTWCGMSIPLPGVASPANIARVELAPSLIVQGVLDGEADIGDRVVLVPTLIAAGQEAYTGYGFTRSDHE
ncbi:zinc ribbon domain-containing protein [Mycolicibacterium holsaticum]|jgi:uncharacterized OB-fold protein|uniref:zinc ribbon domain-containing protein n=1 Tax=Mycolicibacterium holsaticum TaxID=152142 RepID=UPI001C7DCAA8|nr:zinc ribbon domain-containing protein [Mycolicibacterium holsaticum]MDA4109313.1 DNA-binding protein [Mycolicibacterium holsaticum DSM 44478 = JCM 12374]QZA11700.1 hypothetical protein K3U96_21290 [Mycolicibacterium holsaticum DSM 44478 = JCM 12374]UNC10813.1 hypothetical protein H5U41_05540 [Mycolicibacterium holsaticum DSM 44478 = JCM 12374]